MLKRMTTQKRIVYDTIEDLGHVSMEMLIETIKQNSKQISLATIYRNIQSLLQENKIKIVKLKDQDVLETIKKDHGHFVCEKCGEIFDIEIDKANILTKAKSSKYYIEQCDVTFYGLCQNCKNKKEKENEVRM